MVGRGIGKRSAIALALIAGSAASRPAYPADATIEMFQSAFLPQSVSIEPGGSVSWIWRKGSHVVASGLPDGKPGTSEEPGALFEAPVDEGHPEFTFRFGEDASGAIPFFCRSHPGQVGYVEILEGEVTVRVAVVDNFFNPEEVFIFEGDSVRWEHEPNEGFHTVTSGRSSKPEDDPGALFDEESSDLRPIFVYRFGEPAVYPYFCRPHEHMGMKGTVRVQRKFLRGDANSDGKVNIADPIFVLYHLFLAGPEGSCADSLDADDSGDIDMADPVGLLRFLFQSGAPPPKPFPRPGPDRTDDALRCGP